MELKNMGKQIDFFENAIYTTGRATDEEYLQAYIKYIKTGAKGTLLQDIKTVAV